MARFNQNTVETIKTTNLAGGQAYSVDKEWEFASLLLTSFLQDEYYRSGQSTMNRIQTLTKEIGDKHFLAQTATYARNEFGMRSVSHVVAGEIAGTVRGQKWVKDFIQSAIYRVDDMTEIMSYYLARFGRKGVAPQLKKGLARAFDKFDRYQLAKYRAEGKEVSLVDIVNMVHPRPTDTNHEALSDLVKGTLRSTDTWEAKLTKAGQEGGSKTQEWESLVRERKLGYLGLLRNLRNIATYAPHVLNEACNQLTDENAIKKSLVFPFQLWTAYQIIRNEITGAEGRLVTKAIGDAMEISLSNVPKLSGRTLVAIDSSGSMSGRPSENATIFGAVIAKTSNADIMTFDGDARYEPYDLDEKTIAITDRIMGHFRGGSTNFHSIFKRANQAYDRIFIISDMQGWVGNYSPVASFNQYKRAFMCNPKIYSFDMSGYGTTQFPQRGIYCLAGFSSKILDIIPALEQDREALVSAIKQTTFTFKPRFNQFAVASDDEIMI